MNAPRSGCPINLTLEARGDRWSLIIIRDLMLGNRRHWNSKRTSRGFADEPVKEAEQSKPWMTGLGARPGP